MTWTDPLGASNRKRSYHAPDLNVLHEAHVAAPAPGTHQIAIADQPGCRVHSVRLDGTLVGYGSMTLDVRVPKTQKDLWIAIRVKCRTS